MVTTPSDIVKSTINLTGLAKHLVQNNLLSAEEAAKAVEESRKANNMSLVTYLVSETKKVKDMDMARVASREFNIPLFDLSAFDLEFAKEFFGTIDEKLEKLIRQHRALPLSKRAGRIFVAISDPTNVRALEDIRFQTQLNAEPVIVSDSKLADFIERALDKTKNQDMENLDDSLADVETSTGEGTPAIGVSAEGSSDDAPVVKFVNQMLLKAINMGASDLHFEPYEHFYRVRFRVDGILQEIAKPPSNLAPRIAARLKVISQLDIAERRVPQDGRIRLHLSKNKAIDFRVNTLPTLFGEKIVLRILDPNSAKLGIEMLGYEDFQREILMKAIHRPQGMVLVTGPTGSGKTVSLYTCLNILNTSETNISTAEDPVEINLAGINQVNVNVRTGMTFANALRAFLRQDPDIIMVGEIRDLETAEIAIKAAQTGHMVLSTLHTNSAPETLTRLMNMGVKPFNIASSVTVIVAQRLARRLCKICKEEVHLPEETLRQEFAPLLRQENEPPMSGPIRRYTIAELKELPLYQPVGCEQCNNGYKGRVGIYEVMPISPEMGRLIMSGGNSIQIADLAQAEGVPNLRQSALKKFIDGLTSLTEVNRVTKD